MGKRLLAGSIIQTMTLIKKLAKKRHRILLPPLLFLKNSPACEESAVNVRRAHRNYRGFGLENFSTLLMNPRIRPLWKTGRQTQIGQPPKRSLPTESKGNWLMNPGKLEVLKIPKKGLLFAAV